MQKFIPAAYVAGRSIFCDRRNFLERLTLVSRAVTSYGVENTVYD